MHIIEVIPLEKSVWADTLTYFSAQEIPIGSLVHIPLRSKSVTGLVIGAKKAREEKTSIKSSSFSMKKVGKIISPRFSSDAFITAARETSRFYAAPFGATLTALLPLNLIKKIPEARHEPAPTARPTLQAIQNDSEERFSQYRSLIREAFRHKESVLFLVPTIQEAETALEKLSKGIEEYSLLLHSKKTLRALTLDIERIYKETHPLLMVSTPGFIGIAADRAGTIIVERENSASYKQRNRPFIDFRFFIRTYARHAHARLIFGDTILSSALIERYYEHEIDELVPLKWRRSTKSRVSLIDMKPYKPSLKGVPRALSDELIEKIRTARASADRVIVFAGRKGLAPTTICGDCGTLLSCSVCGHPTVLHGTSEKNRFFLCHRCGEKIDASIRCASCNSWKLATFGIGTELVERELHEVFDDLVVIRMDSESVTNRKQAKALIEKFYNSPGSVLVGTEFMLPYLLAPVGTVAIASIDELFSIPDFRINERVSYLLGNLIEFAEREFIIQTRTENSHALASFAEGSLSSFFQGELALRKTLLYPPFSVPIKITLSGQKEVISKEMHALVQALAPQEIDIFPVFLKQAKNKSGLSGVMKIPAKEWPNERILSILRSLPPSAELSVDPESFT